MVFYILFLILVFRVRQIDSLLKSFFLSNVHFAGINSFPRQVLAYQLSVKKFPVVMWPVQVLTENLIKLTGQFLPGKYF